jgi:hypothetical protein
MLLQSCWSWSEKNCVMAWYARGEFFSLCFFHSVAPPDTAPLRFGTLYRGAIGKNLWMCLEALPGGRVCLAAMVGCIESMGGGVGGPLTELEMLGKIFCKKGGVINDIF